MTAQNANTLWARSIVAELASAGIDAVCVAPGSRSTPLTVAAAEHDDIRIFSHLDERSAAFFALGRARETGRPTPCICTSGTAAANFHPAVIEASQGRVPLLLLTADRPRELRDSGANQTIDQTDLYGDAVRWARDLADPEADDRKLRSLRTTVGRALAASVEPPAGPVHLNIPFRKPLEPDTVTDEVPDDFDAAHPVAAGGREGPYLRSHRGRLAPDLDGVADALTGAQRPLIVAGPTSPEGLTPEAAGRLTEALEAPILADPLSGLRFGPHVADQPVIGLYDLILEADPAWPRPDLVIRFGASPTSKPLRRYLGESEATQLQVDPAAGWREAEFSVTDRLVADPDRTADAIARIASSGSTSWRDRWTTAEAAASETIADTPYFEGAILRDAVEYAPAGATLFVSNSMPVRDLDRFGRPRPAPLGALGNRGASGIDGIISSGLGAASATSGPLVLVLGDLAYYHDMNGLLAVQRCEVDATIVLVNNDGGGIFHMLPIAEHDTFETHFRTPHGLDFEPTGELYDLEVSRVGDLSAFKAAYEAATDSDGTQVIEAVTDAADSHDVRESLTEAVTQELA